MLNGEITGMDSFLMHLKRFPDLHERATKSALSSTGYMFMKTAKETGKAGISMLGWIPRSPYTGTLAGTNTGRKGAQSGIYSRKRERYKKRGKNYRSDETGKRMHEMWLSDKLDPYGKLVNAIRYAPDSGTMSVVLGFVRQKESAKITNIARAIAEGRTIAFSPKMRRMFWALHLPIPKGKSQTTYPGRPLVGKVFAAQRDALTRHFCAKYSENLNRYITSEW